MTRLFSRARRLRADDGSALILALVVIVAIGILMSTALSFASSSVLHAPKIRDLRNQTYYAQGAVDGGINLVRGSSVDGTFINGSSGPCPTYSPLSLGSGSDLGADGTTKFRATCTGLDSGNEPGSNAPVWAIQTLGTGGSTVGLITNGNDTLSVDGGVFSANQININGGAQNQMVVEGSVYAKSSCSGKIFTTDPAGPQCNSTTTLGADPSYPPAVASAAALSNLISSSGADPAVSCPVSHGQVAWFSPGYYSEQPITLLKDSSDTNCTGTESVYWFKPGYYYFDFTNAAAGNDWSVNQVVGGTADTSSGDWTKGTVAVPWGSACVSTTNADSSPTTPGVQFIFGGDSTMSFGNGDKIELCGPNQSQNPGSTQSIALYGLGGDAAADATVQGTSTPTSQGPTTYSATAAPTSTTIPFFAPTSGATNIGDGSSAVATIPNGTTASLDYSGFNIPPGAHVTSLTFHVSRTFTGALKTEKLKATWPNGKTWTSGDLPSSCSPCDVTANIPAGAAEGWRVGLDYSAKGDSGGAVVTMDGIAATVSYIPPTLESLTPNHGTFVDSGISGSPHVTMQMHGTVYVPGVGMTIEDQSSGEVIFSRGVIAWTLNVNANPSFTQIQAPFQVPGIKSSRIVQFVGSMSTDGGSTWTDLVQACVKFNDNNSSGSPGPALPGYTLTVKHWTVLRAGTGAGPPCP